MLHPVRVLELPTGMRITLGVGRRLLPSDTPQTPPPPAPTAGPVAPPEDDA